MAQRPIAARRGILGLIAGLLGGYFGQGYIDELRNLVEDDLSDTDRSLEDRAAEPGYEAVRNNIDEWQGELVVFRNYRVIGATQREASDSRYSVVFSGNDASPDEDYTLYSIVEEPVPEDNVSYDVYCRVDSITTYQSLTGPNNAIEINIKELDRVEETNVESTPVQEPVTPTQTPDSVGL